MEPTPAFITAIGTFFGAVLTGLLGWATYRQSKKSASEQLMNGFIDQLQEELRVRDERLERLEKRLNDQDERIATIQRENDTLHRTNNMLVLHMERLYTWIAGGSRGPLPPIPDLIKKLLDPIFWGGSGSAD